MPKIFLAEHTSILKAFNEYHVDYLLIGGYAAIYHGYDRTSLIPEEWSDEETLSSEVMTFNKTYAEKMCEEIGDGAFICDPPEITFADIIEDLE